MCRRRILLWISEADVRVEKLWGGTFEEGDIRRQAGQRRRIVLGGHIDCHLRVRRAEDCPQPAVVIPHDDVEIAVTVEIAERGGAIGANADAGDRDQRPKGGRRRRAGVGDLEQLAEVIPHDDVEVAIAVEIAERRGGTVLKVDAGDLDQRAEARRRAVPVLVTVNSWPSKFPTTMSRSPSPSRSPRVGAEKSPASRPAIWAGVPNTGAAAVPVLVIVNSPPEKMPRDDVEIAIAVEIAESAG